MWSVPHAVFRVAPIFAYTWILLNQVTLKSFASRCSLCSDLEICTGTVVNNWKFCYNIHKCHITLLCLLGKRLGIAFTCVFVRRHVYLWKGDWSHQFRGFFRFVPSIPDNQGYLRFSVFIGQQNLGQPGNTKVPHHLGFYWLMKTRLKSSIFVSSSMSSVSCPFLLADAKWVKQLLIGTFESHSSLEKWWLLSSSLAFVISADTWLGCVFKAVFSPS